MVKKALHHFSRLTVFLLEAAGVLAVLVFLAWIGLMIRLSHGPLNVDFLTAYLQKSLSEQQKDFIFAVGRTELVWGGRFEPFELQMDGAKIGRADGTPVLAVDRIGVQLSKRNLLFGRIVPRAITIHGPVLRVVRGEDGRFSLNIATTPDQPAEQAPQAGEPELIKGLLLKLQERRLPLVGGLNQLSITDAIVTYEDRGLHAAWKSRRSDISFTRGTAGISAEAHISVALDAEQAALLDMRAYYAWETQTTNVLAAFTGLNPARAAQGAASMQGVSGVDMPLKGSFAMALDASFAPGMTRFAVGAGPGTFNAGGLYATPIHVKAADIGGYVNFKTWEGAIEHAHLDLGGPVADATVKSTPDGGRKIVQAQATLTAMPVDDLKIFWPDSLAPDPRSWVTKHLSKGVASKATLDMALAIDENAEKKVTVDKLGGHIDFKGIKVDYFPPLMPVLDVDGAADYDKKSFNLDLKSGALGDMKVEKSAIHITGLDTQDETHHSKIDVAVTLHGPLKTALRVLDSDPLGYPKELGLKAEEVGGNADVDVGFTFPLYHALQLKDIHVSARAKLRDVSLKGLVSDYAVTGGPMDLAVDNSDMTVSGSGKLGSMPVTFVWSRNFAPGAAVPGKLTAKLPLDAAALVKFGVPADMNVGGDMASDVAYVQSVDGTASLTLKGDITRTSFEVPFAGFKKDAGIPGTLGLVVHLKDGKAGRITDLSLQTEKTALKGDIAFDASGLQSAAFGQLAMGDTDVALSASRSGAGYKVNISGRQLDLSKVIAGNGTPNSDAEAAKKSAPVTVSLGVGRVITGKDKAMDNARILLKRNEWQRIDQLELDGTAGGGAVTIRYEPAQGGHSLRMQAANAGAALSALGVSNGVRGGKLSVEANPSPKSGPRDMAGTVTLTGFTLKDVPALGRLLNAMSLTGIIELLNGRGIAFSKARADFFWTDRGQPDSQKNVRDIRLKDGETSGASLGLTFEGHIDQWNNVYDLGGTIIPVSDLNKLVASIPLVGNLLTANGEGVFAATYSIKGPKDQPNVMVNPLAVLAPGVLRKLFFER